MTGLATLVLTIHLLWIIWVVGGAFWTRGRPLLTLFHVLSLAWGITVEISPWPCPLTLAEQFLQRQAAVNSYQGGFLAHFLDRLVYPELPDIWITAIGVTVCGLNLGVYIWRYWRGTRQTHGSSPTQV